MNGTTRKRCKTVTERTLKDLQLSPNKPNATAFVIAQTIGERAVCDRRNSNATRNVNRGGTVFKGSASNEESRIRGPDRVIAIGKAKRREHCEHEVKWEPSD
jgi:hypothetical protein